MKYSTRWRIIVATAGSAALLLLGPGNALATTPHENPETAAPVFSGIALFQYYSSALDAVILRDGAEAEARLSKAPWANVPQTLADATGAFAVSGVSLVHLMTRADQDLVRLKTLREQSRLDEGREAAAAISGNLTAARSDLARLERAVTAGGREFGAAAAPESSDLTASYRQVLDRIDVIRKMLSLRGQLLATEVEAIDLSGRPAAQRPEQTAITLSVDPLAAFVGEQVAFQGTLTSDSGPLAQREVEILLNSSSNVTVRTDAAGHYQGTLEVPFWYQPEIEVQALYYPRDADRGAYLAAISPAVRLQVRYYTARLELEPETKAYPGRATRVIVRFDYGDAPPLAARELEVYFDGRLIGDLSSASVQTTFAFDLDPDVTVGRHLLTASAAAQGRYAPSLASAALEVTRMVPVVEMSLPRIIVVPGSLRFKGRVYSELGPLDGTTVRLRFGKSEIELTSRPGGVLSGNIMNRGLDLGIIGDEDVTVLFEPAEPWYAPVTATRHILVVNAANGGAVVIAFAVLGIYLPARLRKRFGQPARKRSLPAIGPTVELGAVVQTRDATTIQRRSDGGPAEQVVFWYRQAADLVERVAGVALKPQQTLREFALEARHALGPAAAFFTALTGLLERIVYSGHRPTAGDVEQSRQLSTNVREQVRG